MYLESVHTRLTFLCYVDASLRLCFSLRWVTMLELL